MLRPSPHVTACSECEPNAAISRFAPHGNRARARFSACDALALLRLLRVCGVEPAAAGDGLMIRPHVPRSHFVLDTPLLRLEVQPQRVALTYRPAVSGSRAFTIYHKWGGAAVMVNGEVPSDICQADDHVVVPVAFRRGQPFKIRVEPL